MSMTTVVTDSDANILYSKQHTYLGNHCMGRLSYADRFGVHFEYVILRWSWKRY